MDSNHGPPRYKLGALPTELYAHSFIDIDIIKTKSNGKIVYGIAQKENPSQKYRSVYYSYDYQ